MDGKTIRLVQYLEGSDKRFIIPVYQRNYSWKKIIVVSYILMWELKKKKR